MIPNATSLADLPPRAPFALPITIIEEAGVTAWLVEDPSVPVVSMNWAWRGGSAFDPSGHEGMMALAAAMLTEGAGDLDNVAFADAARDAGVSISFGVGRDSTSGSLRALSDALPEAIRLARLAMTEPRLDARDLDRVRARAIVGARQALETPRGIASRAFWAAGFPGHPAGRASSPESFAAIPATGLTESLARQFRSEGLLIAAAGAITAAELRAAITALFGGLPRGVPPALPELPPLAQFGRQVVEKAAPQSAVQFGQNAPLPTDPRWEASQVALRILGGGGFSSRLMKLIREERGLTYGIGAGMDVLFGRGVIVGQASTDNRNAGDMVALLEQSWRAMANDGPTAEELSEAVDFLNGSLPLSFSDSRRIAGGLLSLMQNNRTPAWLAGRPARLSALTRDDVARAARLFGETPLSIMVAGQPIGL
jgi:zinc protease